MNQVFWEIFANMAGYLQAGGVVMIPLIIVSVCMWTLIVYKGLFLRRMATTDLNRYKALLVAFGSGDTAMHDQSAIALLCSDFALRKTGRIQADTRILDECEARLSVTFGRYIALIGALCKVAPLLGLLGTVLGMITTFDVIAAFGTGNARAMAGGISEALISTQTGLLVAIPGMYMLGFLERKAESLGLQLQAVSMEIRRNLADDFPGGSLETCLKDSLAGANGEC